MPALTENTSFSASFGSAKAEALGVMFFPTDVEPLKL